MLSKARFILSRKEVLKKYEELRAISDFISYSYKTNFDVGHVLEDETDSYFSVHSMASFLQLKNPKRIWYFAQGWDKNEIESLLTKGGFKFVVDNLFDLNLLLDYMKGRKEKVDVLLRMKLKEHTIHTGKHFVFGFYSSKVNELLPILKENKNVGNLGIHFHRKTQNVSEWSLQEELNDTIFEENWKYIDFVNIGGGIPGIYKNFSSSILKGIFKKINDLKKWLNSKNIKMIIEPGRYVASSPVKLEANIKNIYDNNIIIDCSVYNSAMDTFVAHIRLLVEGELENGDAYTIKGCTPDSMDIFRYRVFLKNPKIGEKIIFLNAGAYTYATDFCNLPKLETVFED